jgi:hypothetical protein
MNKTLSGKAILAAVDNAVTRRWEHALTTAAAATGTTEERVAQVADRIQRELTAAGAAAGGVAALPGAGTLTSLGTTGAELAFFTMRSADLVLAIGAVHGHTEADVDQRRAWVLAVLAFGAGAAAGYEDLVGGVGRRVGRGAARALPKQAIEKANERLGRRLIARWGIRRGAAAAGHLIPFGIGAAVGAGINWLSVRGLAKATDRFFRELPADLAAHPD